MGLLETPYAAPKISAVDAFGKVFTGKEFHDKYLVLYFYPKDMTPGCTVEATDFQKFYEDFQDFGCEVVGVSKDSCERHQKFADKESLRFTLLSDESGTLSEEFGVWKEKVNYGKKYMGIERSTFLINPEGKIVAEWRKVKVAGHVESVLSALKEYKKSLIKPVNSPR